MATSIGRIKLSDLELIVNCVSPAPELLEAQKANLANRILAFETQYEMSSQDMKQAVREGSLEESLEFCTWLMLLEIRSRIDRAQSVA